MKVKTKANRRWVCAKKSCRAIHGYQAVCCQRCGHAKLEETDERQAWKMFEAARGKAK